jgi:hypothetical protein
MLVVCHTGPESNIMGSILGSSCKVICSDQNSEQTLLVLTTSAFRDGWMKKEVMRMNVKKILQFIMIMIQFLK